MTHAQNRATMKLAVHVYLMLQHNSICRLAYVQSPIYATVQHHTLSLNYSRHQRMLETATATVGKLLPREKNPISYSSKKIPIRKLLTVP